MTGETPNVPPRLPGLDSMPSLGRPLEQKIMTADDMLAQDPNIPRVPLQIPEFYKGDLDTSSLERNAMSATPVGAPTQAAQPQQEFIRNPNYVAPGQQTQQFVDSAANVAASFAPQRSSSVPAPTPGAFPGSHQLPSKPLKHPVIESLLHDLSIKEDSVYIHEFLGHTYTLRPLTAELMGFATSLASRTATSNDEYIYKLALVSGILSVVAIDDVPCSEIYAQELASLKNPLPPYAPLNPPYAARVKYAPALIDLFMSKLKLNIVQSIAEAYDTAFDEDVTLKKAAESATSDVDQRVHFQCSVEGCGYSENVIPEIIDHASGAIRPRFCTVHGPTMTPIGYVKDLANTPLA